MYSDKSIASQVIVYGFERESNLPLLKPASFVDNVSFPPYGLQKLDYPNILTSTSLFHLDSIYFPHARMVFQYLVLIKTKLVGTIIIVSKTLK